MIDYQDSLRKPLQNFAPDRRAEPMATESHLFFVRYPAVSKRLWKRRQPPAHDCCQTSRPDRKLPDSVLSQQEEGLSSCRPQIGRSEQEHLGSVGWRTSSTQEPVQCSSVRKIRSLYSIGPPHHCGR